MRSAVRVLVVEDDPAISDALTVALGQEGYEVATTGDGASALGTAEVFFPDLALIDVALPPGPDGLAVGRRLRQDRDVPLLFLTAAASPQAVLAGFDAGADDYLTKPFSFPELLARIAALLRRSGRARPTTWRFGDLVVDEDAHRVERAGHLVELTSLELALLVCLLSRPGRVTSKDQIGLEVWGYQDTDAGLIDTHLCRLRHKLEAHGPRLVHTVRGAGYVLRR